MQKEDGIWLGRNSAVIQPGKLDRCPTGIGCSASMALLHQQGILKQGDHYIGESIIGPRFHCSIDAITKVGDRHAIYPLISGQAWITSTHQHILDHSSTFIRFEVPVFKTFPDQFMSDHA